MHTHGSGPLVVVVDSNRRLGAVLGLLIADWGYSCVTAATADEAIGGLGAAVGRVRALVIDDTPGRGPSSGDMTAKAFEALSDERIVTITIQAGDRREAECAEYPILRKPFDPDVLKAWLLANVDQPVVPTKS